MIEREHEHRWRPGGMTNPPDHYECAEPDCSAMMHMCSPVTPHCQHCPNLADERSFMCEDCAAEADKERDDALEEVSRLRGVIRESYDSLHAGRMAEAMEYLRTAG